MSSIIFIGAPGVGKGTQREFLMKKYPHFASIVPGDIMRNEIKNKTDMGRQLEYALNKGMLAPHDLAMKCVTDTLTNLRSEGKKDFIFDGFPREIQQAISIDEFLREEFKIDSVIFFDIDDEVSIQRIKKRAENSGRTDDADEEVIRTRFKEFHAKMNPVLEHYKNILHVIDASRTPEEIFLDLEKTLGTLLAK
ncbi:MAG: nucleoside monophosphate kinase [Cytophagales bacterium]|jgi:adenylate kinase|nr:nucleoside monophosphate kinase [Cytophagales bacterium]